MQGKKKENWYIALQRLALRASFPLLIWCNIWCSKKSDAREKLRIRRAVNGRHFDVVLWTVYNFVGGWLNHTQVTRKTCGFKAKILGRYTFLYMVVKVWKVATFWWLQWLFGIITAITHKN